MQSIRTKLLFFTSAIIFLVSGSITYFTSEIGRAERMRDQLSEIMLLTRTVSAIIVDDVYYMKRATIREYLAALYVNKDIMSTLVLDREGNVITDGTTQNPGRDKKPGLDMLDQILMAKGFIGQLGEQSLWVGGPITPQDGETVGYIYIQMSLISTNRDIDRQVLKYISITSVCMAVALFLTILFSDRLTARLSRLTSRAHRIARGEEDLALEIKGRDEIAELGRAFEVMVGHLHTKNQQLENLANTLDQKVLARTKQLTKRERALKGAKEQAETANRAKSNFLAVMTHEIRTPMNALLGMLDLLQSSDLNDKQKDYAQTARTSGDMLMAIINDILDFSKIEANKIDLDIKSFALKEFMEEMVDIYYYKTRKKGLDIDLKLVGNLPEKIKTDPHRLQQVLGNLLDNAVKFTDEGSVTLSLEKQDDFLLFSIQDTGKGIPENMQGALFSEFSQEDNSISRRYGGTGLGLAICKRLVELMGGTIGLQSTPQKGSCFYFTLPLPSSDNIA